MIGYFAIVIASVVVTVIVLEGYAKLSLHGVGFRDYRMIKGLKQKYDETKDKSRKGEIQRAKDFGVGHFAGGEPESDEPELVAPRPSEHGERELQMATPSEPIAENSDGKRKTGSSSRGIFRKLRRR